MSILILSPVSYVWAADPAPPASSPAGKAPKNPRVCPSDARVKLYSTKDSGDIIEGPACVGVEINVLRYSVEFGRSITVSAGPNLAAGLAPPAAAGGAELSASGTRSMADQITEIVDLLSGLRGTANSFDAHNAIAAATVAQAVTDLKALVSASDDLFRANGAAAVVSAAKDAALQREIAAAQSADWRATDQILVKAKALQARVADLLLRNPSDADKARLGLVQASIAAFITDITPSTTAGDKTKDFYSQKAIVLFWERLLKDLKVESFIRTT